MSDLIISNARRLSKLRIDAGLKQDYVANVLGVTEQTISKWERGITEPKMSMLYSIAQLYNVDLLTLLNSDSDILKKKRCNEMINKSVSTIQEAVFNTKDAKTLKYLESSIRVLIEASKSLNR